MAGSGLRLVRPGDGQRATGRRILGGKWQEPAIDRALQLCADGGIDVGLNCIFGFADETPDDRARTLELLDRAGSPTRIPTSSRPCREPRCTRSIEGGACSETRSTSLPGRPSASSARGGARSSASITRPSSRPIARPENSPARLVAAPAGSDGSNGSEGIRRVSRKVPRRKSEGKIKFFLSFLCASPPFRETPSPQSLCLLRSRGERRRMSWARSNSASHSATTRAVASSAGGTRPVGQAGPSWSAASRR